MRRGLIALVLGYGLFLIADGVASAWVTADLAARPVVALLRDGTPGQGRIAVWEPQGETGAPPADRAQLLGSEGVALGLALRFRMPDGTAATCTQRLAWLRCAGGWRAERRAAPP